ncbi:hypothetical protein L226DRAFT_597293 [Lentinus tigrinus ALCF2SS1-7]|uniref:uncharacterized protein n=1 Tax=Lentinus tigrinus ALCF2SS1-7 TaxID=1328758 RepID=UPI00116639EA|nr:hypothetical protein L226DRAFT_597293 [Lentinus tigrinus ALCF2SS1-7]
MSRPPSAYLGSARASVVSTTGVEPPAISRARAATTRTDETDPGTPYKRGNLCPDGPELIVACRWHGRSFHRAAIAVPCAPPEFDVTSRLAAGHSAASVLMADIGRLLQSRRPALSSGWFNETAAIDKWGTSCERAIRNPSGRPIARGQYSQYEPYDNQEPGVGTG